MSGPPKTSKRKARSGNLRNVMEAAEVNGEECGRRGCAVLSRAASWGASPKQPGHRRSRFAEIKKQDEGELNQNPGRRT